MQPYICHSFVGYFQCQQEIKKAYDIYKPRMDDVDLASLIFRDFGKGCLKKGNVSPDAFVQMAIQLANYRVRLLLLE